MKSQGLSALLTQRVRGPETLAVGHLAYTAQGDFQKPGALATPPFVLRGKGLYISRGLLQKPGMKSGSPATPCAGPGRPPSAPCASSLGQEAFPAHSLPYL